MNSARADARILPVKVLNFKMAVSAQKLVSEQKPNFADKKEMRAHVRIHIQRRLSTILDCALQTLRNALVI